MAMSGVTVQDQCVKMWERMKTSKIKSCQFKLTKDNKQIEVDEASVIEKGTEGAWKKFTSSLPDNECRYAIYDVDMSIDLGAGLPAGTRTKLTFIVWSPSSSPIKQKMISAASKDALKKKLDGCQVEWQLTDRSELEVKDRVDDLKDLPDIKTSGNGILKFEGHAV